VNFDTRHRWSDNTARFHQQRELLVYRASLNGALLAVRVVALQPFDGGKGSALRNTKDLRDYG
jgi:hypothetical protein